MSAAAFSSVVLIGTLVLLWAPTHKVRAASFDLTDDCPGRVGDVGTLIDAIHQANSTPEADTIILARECVYYLTDVDNYWYGPTGLPAITSTITIAGNGAYIVRDTGTITFRLFYVAGAPTGVPTGTLTLQNLNLAHGVAQGGKGGDGEVGGGGGAGFGGAIFNQGVLVLEGVALVYNTALGGDGGASTGPDAGVGGGGGLGGDGGPGSAGVTAGGGGGGFQGDGASAGSSRDGGDGVESGSGGSGATTTGGVGGFSGIGGSGGRGNLSGAGYGGGGGGFGLDDDGATGFVTGLGGGSGGSGGSGGDGHADHNGDGGSGGNDWSIGVGGGGGGFGGGGGGGVGGGGGGIGGGGGGGWCGGGGGFGGGGGGGIQDAASGGYGGQGGAGGGGGGGSNVAGTSAGAGGQGGVHADGAGGGGGGGIGGAICNHTGIVTITNSTFINNTAQGGKGGNAPLGIGGGAGGYGGDGLGGALFNVNGSVTLINVTMSHNTVTPGGLGYGAYPGDIGDATGGGVCQKGSSAQLTIRNTILANTSGSLWDCHNDEGTVTLEGSSNLIETNDVGGHECGSPAFTDDPDLGALVDRDGFAATVALLPGSPAIDGGTNTGCPAADQRGQPRPFDGDFDGTARCDIGAYEFGFTIYLPLVLR